jgi:hypothetical protein
MHKRLTPDEPRETCARQKKTLPNPPIEVVSIVGFRQGY